MTEKEKVIHVPKFALDRLWPEHDHVLGFYVVLLSFISTIVSYEGKICGLVLDGEPMTQQEWASLFQVPRSTLQRHLGVLQEHGLIALKRLPYAVRIVAFGCWPKGKKANIEDHPWMEELQWETSEQPCQMAK